MYGDYAAQPDIGLLDRREGLLASGSVKLDANWVVRGSALYDIRANNFAQNSIGVGYVNDCLILGINYVTNYTYGTGTPQLTDTYMLQLSLARSAAHRSASPSGQTRPRIDASRRTCIRLTAAPAAMDIAMPRTSVRFPSFRRWLAAAALAAAIAAPSAASAQVVVIANGSPITAYDIEQRSKLIATLTHKTPTRQEVIKELIDYRIKIAKAKSYGLRDFRGGGRRGIQQHGQEPVNVAAAIFSGHRARRHCYDHA